MSSTARKNVVLVFDGAILSNENEIDKTRLSKLRSVLNQLGYSIVKEFKWTLENAQGCLDEAYKVDAQFVITLVGEVYGEYSEFLRMADFESSFDYVRFLSSQNAEKTERNICKSFFRALYRQEPLNTKDRCVLILVLKTGDPNTEQDFRTEIKDNIFKLGKDQWKSNSDHLDGTDFKVVESDFKAVVQLVFDRWQQQIMASSAQESTLCSLKIGHEVFGNAFLEDIEELLGDEVGFEPIVRKRFFLTLLPFCDRNIPDAMKLLVALHLLNAMKMARRLSSFTLEGEKFSFWVIMDESPEKNKQLLEIRGFTLIFLFNDDTRFDIAREKDVRDIVELCLGDSVFLLVDLRTNRIVSVWGRPSSFKSLHEMKDSFKDIAVFGLHVRDDERVEVLDGHFNVSLIWDGFKWKQSDSSTLEVLLEDMGLSGKRIVVDAVDELLNGGYSSIFLIVHEDDKCKWNKVSDKSLRSDLLPPRGSLASLKVDTMNASQLAAILRLDGAHLLDREGRLYQVCRNLSFQPEAWNVWTPVSTDRSTDPSKVKLDKKLSKFVKVIKGDVSWFIDLKVDKKGGLDDFVNHMRAPLDSRVFERNLLLHLHLIRATTTTAFECEKIAQGKYDLYTCHESWSFANDDNFSLFVKVSYPRANREGLNFDCIPDGLFVDDQKAFYVNVLKIPEVRQVLDSSSAENAPLLSQSLDHWFRTGCVSGSGSSGTGSRAALAASKVLSKSLVVKISASGKLLVFRGGRQISGISDPQSS
jgi:hypothetical protein